MLSELCRDDVIVGRTHRSIGHCDSGTLEILLVFIHESSCPRDKYPPLQGSSTHHSRVTDVLAINSYQIVLCRKRYIVRRKIYIRDMNALSSCVAEFFRLPMCLVIIVPPARSRSPDFLGCGRSSSMALIVIARFGVSSCISPHTLH